MDIELYILILSGLGIIGICAFIFSKRYLSRLVDKRISAYQNDLMTNHYWEVENIYKQMRGWRHDYHNHIQTMKAHIQAGQTDGLLDYLDSLNDDLLTVDTIVKTGNIMIDAILNSKLSLAKSRNININAKAIVPSQLNISEVDLCVVVGNLIDNAMEACLKQESEADRFIRVYIGVLKGQLYISVSNSVAGRTNKKEGKYISSKGSPTHGFGLMRIDKIAAKYEGFVNRQDEKGVFATEILLKL
jgi:sensor histidine kinase regulating citrate/malate metabolism